MIAAGSAGEEEGEENLKTEPLAARTHTVLPPPLRRNEGYRRTKQQGRTKSYRTTGTREIEHTNNAKSNTKKKKEKAQMAERCGRAGR